MTIELRKFPYPFQAALTICSDIDGTNLKNFLEIHKFLNTTQETSMGQGLGLPIGNSFWMYDRPDIADHAFAYFKNLNGKESRAAPIIRNFIKAGILDVMHSYGNFASATDFSRRVANQALEELDKHGLKINVWTNHGGLESTQNIGKKSLGMGDIKDNIFYHTDLLLNYGIQFYWDTEAALRTAVGQDCPAKFGDAYWNSPLYQNWHSRLKNVIKGVLTLSDKFIYPMTKKHIIPWIIIEKNQNDLISNDVLRDGQRIYKFRRFGLGAFDWSDDLPRLLNQRVLLNLISKHGYLILYIHLGDRRSKDVGLPLCQSSINTLKRIANLYSDGTLWIDTTSRLLKYNLVSKSLSWNVKENNDKIIISINGLLPSKVNYDLTIDDLAGLTFYVPPHKSMELFFQQKSLKFKINPVDYSGRESISLPLMKLTWPI